MVAEMQLDNSWRGLVSSKSPSSVKVYKYKGYKGPPIVNEYELQREIMYNNRLPEPNDNVDPDKTRLSREEVVRKCHSEHYQGTKDEHNYFRVVTPVKRVIRGKTCVKNKGKIIYITKEPDEIVWEPKKMYFKNFYQYLDYISSKNGSRPRLDFFSNEKDFQNAYASWEKKVNRTTHGFNGSNWNTYVYDNYGVVEYLNRCKEDERKRNEYVQSRRKELIKMKKVAQGDNDQENWRIASGRNCRKLTQKRKVMNSKKSGFNTPSISTRDVSPERPRLINTPSLVKVVN